MLAICKKEFQQFFTSLTGVLAISVFLLLTGLIVFVFPDNLLDFGYASLDKFFDIAPWIFTFMIPAVTMRSFSDEFRGGTFEILQTRPLTNWQLVTGKYFGSLLVMVIALIPTAVYVLSVQALSENGGLDAGATIGAFTGLFFLAATFTAIGICCSSFSNNAVVSFIVGALACFLIYSGFTSISRLPALQSGADYYLEMIGIDYHYRSMSRGVIDSRDVIYFISIITLFLVITNRNLSKR